MNETLDMDVIREIISRIPEADIDAILTVLVLSGQLPGAVKDMTPQARLAYAVEQDAQAVAEAAIFVILFA